MSITTGQKIEECIEVMEEMHEEGIITDWEYDFLEDVSGLRYFSPKQKEVIDKIYQKACDWDEPARKRS